MRTSDGEEFGVERGRFFCSIRGVIPLNPFDSDFLFAESCLAGDPGSAERLKALLDEGVTHVVIRAGASPSMARDLIQDLMSDLMVGLGGRPPLLQKYGGRSSLRSWLVSVAVRRCIDQKRRQQRMLEQTLAEDGTSSGRLVDPPAPHPDDEVLTPLLREAIGAAMREQPAEDFVLFRLLHAEGLHQTELARMFGIDRRTIARHSERIASDLRSSIMTHLVSRVPEFKLEWRDVVDLCHGTSSDLFEGN